MKHNKTSLLFTTILIASIITLSGCTQTDSDTGAAVTPTTSTATTIAPTASTTTNQASTIPTSAADATAIPTEGTSEDDSASTPDTTDKGAIIAEFTDFDQNASWDADATTIVLNDASTAITGTGAAFAETSVTISEEGTYVLSGTLSDGQILVNVDSSEKVQLVLNGVTITNSASAAIFIQNADKVSVTLADGTTNTLTDGSTYESTEEDAANACLCSKDDLTINGTGTLTVNGNYNNGISSSNDLRIVSGTINITAENNALKGNDSVGIMGGTLTISSNDDGIKSDTDDTENKGYVYISGGSIVLETGDDAIQAVTSVGAVNCSLTLNAIGKDVNCDGVIDVADGCVQ